MWDSSFPSIDKSFPIDLNKLSRKWIEKHHKTLEFAVISGRYMWIWKWAFIIGSQLSASMSVWAQYIYSHSLDFTGNLKDRHPYKCPSSHLLTIFIIDLYTNPHILNISSFIHMYRIMPFWDGDEDLGKRLTSFILVSSHKLHILFLETT